MTNTNGQLVELGKRLLVAAKNGELEIVKELLTATAPIAIDWLGNSPLHLAAQNGHTAVVETLLDHGVFVNLRSKMDRTALHFAAMEGHVEIVELLISRGADLQLTDMLRMTALHWAAERQHVAVCEMLLRHGASPCSPMNKFDKTPLDIASEKAENDQLTELFSRYRARFDVLSRYDDHHDSKVLEQPTTLDANCENDDDNGEYEFENTAELDEQLEDVAEDEVINETYDEHALLEGVDPSVERFSSSRFDIEEEQAAADTDDNVETACLTYSDAPTNSASCDASDMIGTSDSTADEVNLVLSLPPRSNASPTNGTSTLQFRVNTDDAMRFLNARATQIRRFLFESDAAQSPLTFTNITPPYLTLTEAGRLVLDTLGNATTSTSYGPTGSCSALPRVSTQSQSQSQSPATAKRGKKRSAASSILLADEADEHYDASASAADTDGVLSLS